MMQDKVLAVLKDGPATSRDVADELEIDVQLASAFLSQLCRRGTAKVLDKIPKHGKTINLFALA